MTIYVCQELEQNRAPLQQKRDGGGDPSLCGGLWGAPPDGGWLQGGRVREETTQVLLLGTSAPICLTPVSCRISCC